MHWALGTRLYGGCLTLIKLPRLKCRKPFRFNNMLTKSSVWTALGIFLHRARGTQLDGGCPNL